ncbi:hypothetical protein R75465_08499 [Paraburkholderia aspalathi]|uniref:SMI1/KNR4 family protein n=1 Tax=Paraburkholderia aspalathi TaxID=1324617 RepID=UPI001B02EBD3|nr:SMI1/KNR4 family protein [Paraburkholderia aspalathi]CAE6874284.1 hypothetical protein R75465_08499 [Paraburkholderia aspalathi]
MDLKPRGSLPAPSSDTVAHVEMILRVKLPQEYLNLLAAMNGAYIEENIFDIPGGNHAGVSRFIPFDKVLYEKSLVEQTGPTEFLPIADASGGNYICLSIGSNDLWGVYFFDHEIPGDDALTKIAQNLPQFLDILKPFSVDDVQLGPNEGGHTWIDPEFLKEIKGGSPD